MLNTIWTLMQVATQYLLPKLVGKSGPQNLMLLLSMPLLLNLEAMMDGHKKLSSLDDDRSKTHAGVWLKLPVTMLSQNIPKGSVGAIVTILRTSDHERA